LQFNFHHEEGEGHEGFNGRKISQFAENHHPQKSSAVAQHVAPFSFIPFMNFMVKLSVFCR